MPAPRGKDADPKEYRRYFEGRGRRLAAIGARVSGAMFAGGPLGSVAMEIREVLTDGRNARLVEALHVLLQ